MSKQYDYSIYIGRFQPFHNAHQAVAEKALDNSQNLIFVIGSDLSPRTIENPFTADERIRLIRANLEEKYEGRLFFVKTRDYLYNDNIWATGLQNKIDTVIPDREGKKICLVGSLKDDSSYYLKMFPQWKRDFSRTLGDISATKIRNVWFNPLTGIKDLPDVSEITKDWLLNFGLNNRSEKLSLDFEYRYIQGYKESWSVAPYPVTFQTVDAVVFKSAHVLVVKRKVNPGKGLLAVPGGFLNQNETLIQGALRELEEETKIVYPHDEIHSCLVDQKVFDHPKRSLRGRTITQAFNFDLGLGSLPQVKGADDAEQAFWMPFSDVGRNIENFFEDHAHIIEYFMYKQGRM